MRRKERIFTGTCIMSFWDDFTGASARGDLKKSKTQSDAALATGYAGQQADYTMAANSFDPYVQSGNAANTFYSNALGLNGNDARASAQSTITSDPLWQGTLANDQNAAYKALNARGLGASGSAMLAGQRVLSQDYGNWLDRYSALGSQGLNATGQQANALMGRGNNAFSYGATQAGNDISYGNAMAANRNVGLNNVLGVLGAATGGYNALFNGGGRKATGYSGQFDPG
jgi:hypothetical protein